MAKKSGLCALTHTRGPYVKSHLIPRAFTDRNLDKVGRIEWGEDALRPKLSYTGWYDNELVTAIGEHKLEKHDSAGAAEIRKHGLCWRFFPLSEKAERDRVADIELVHIPDVDTKRLRLFFLSLLWRAAATTHVGFREIRMDVSSFRKLRKIVNGEIEPHRSDFPMVLVLLSTKGQPQNLTPLRQRIPVPQIAPGLLRDVKIFRFFLDGLIVHVGRKSMDSRLLRAWESRAVGLSDTLTLIGVPYAGSSQESNLMFHEFELARRWPDDADRIFGVLSRETR